MAKIINFTDREQADGYRYFDLSVLEGLCNGIVGVEDYIIKVEDNKGIVHEVKGARLDEENRIITLEMQGGRHEGKTR